MSFRPPTALVWFGVLGGPMAWAGQFVINLYFTFAQCNQPGGRWSLPVHPLGVALSCLAVAVGIGATGVCAWMFARTYRIDDIYGQERRGEGSAPPTGRVLFLAIVGLTVNFLTLTIVVMTGIATPLLTVCRQS